MPTKVRFVSYESNAVLNLLRQTTDEQLSGCTKDGVEEAAREAYNDHKRRREARQAMTGTP